YDPLASSAILIAQEVVVWAVVLAFDTGKADHQVWQVVGHKRFVLCTHDQKEIDLIEERDGKLSTYEFKWNEKRKAKMPKTFSETYPNSTFEVISRENFWSFLRG
ncbi:MAG: hypothetical protein J6Z41_08135, partial [Prevotella sp.]|nr:hypothetical protein [Prevotella sp.]